MDRGNDHVAIVRSLLEYARWLEWHHLDPALVTRAYASGSRIELDFTADVKIFRRKHRHIVEIDRAPLAFVVVSELRNVVSFRMTEQLVSRELIDARGRVVDRIGAQTEHYIVSIIRFGPDAPWRLNLVEFQSPAIEVQL